MARNPTAIEIQEFLDAVNAIGSKWTTLGEVASHIEAQPEHRVVDAASALGYVHTDPVDTNWRNTVVTLTSEGAHADVDSDMRQISELAAWGLDDYGDELERAALAENKTDFLRAAADDREDRLEHQREAERGERSFDPDAAYEAHLDRLTGVDHGERAEARGDRVRAETQAMTDAPTHESLPDLAATDTGDPLGIHRARSDELER
jgi:hypothetical protein